MYIYIGEVYLSIAGIGVLKGLYKKWQWWDCVFKVQKELWKDIFKVHKGHERIFSFCRPCMYKQQEI